MKYEVMISSGFHSAVINADSEEEALKAFVQLTRANLGVEQCEAWPCDEDQEEGGGE